MKPVVEGHPYPVSIETTLLRGPKYITLRIGNHGRGQSQMTDFSLAEAEVLAYTLLREVAERKAKIEKFNADARRLNEDVRSARESKAA